MTTHAIPTALRPKLNLTPTPHNYQPTKNGHNTCVDCGLPPREPIDVHIAILVPDLKLFNLIKDRVAVTYPNFQPVRVFGHVVIENPKDKHAGVPVQIRQALCELGLVDPTNIGFAPAQQVTLGWPDIPVTP